MTVDGLENLVLRPVGEWYGAVVDIPCELINPDPENLRQEFDEADLIDLGKEYRSSGTIGRDHSIPNPH